MKQLLFSCGMNIAYSRENALMYVPMATEVSSNTVLIVSDHNRNSLKILNHSVSIAVYYILLKCPLGEGYPYSLLPW